MFDVMILRINFPWGFWILRTIEGGLTIVCYLNLSATYQSLTWRNCEAGDWQNIKDRRQFTLELSCYESEIS
jgi:hypothetical protein